MSNNGSFVAKDFAKLRVSAILMVVLVAAGAALVYWKHEQGLRAKVLLREAEGRHSNIDARLRRVNDEEQEIKTKTALFQTLERRGIVGPEQRLNWVETINRTIARRKLFAITYEISPQQPLGTPVLPYQFGASTMNFRLPLLHENDLTAFINDLRQEAPAIVHVERCRIERASAGGDSSNSAGLLSDCVLTWITLQDTRTGGKK
jgi:hypothetical protein